MSELRDAASVILHSGMASDAEVSNKNIADEEVVVIAPRKRKQRSGEDVATPPTDGDLHITVIGQCYIYSILKNKKKYFIHRE